MVEHGSARGCSALPSAIFHAPALGRGPGARRPSRGCHTLRLADLTRPQLERIMPGVKLRGRIMPAWKRSHAKAPEPKDREVGQLIRAQRLVCRMSQTELANALGVTFQQVQKYEKGVNRVG